MNENEPTPAAPALHCVHFHHFRRQGGQEHVRLFATIAVVPVSEEIVRWGVAFVAPGDQPSYAIGRVIAEGRAQAQRPGTLRTGLCGTATPSVMRAVLQHLRRGNWYFHGKSYDRPFTGVLLLATLGDVADAESTRNAKASGSKP